MWTWGIIAAANDIIEQIPGDPAWVPLGVGGAMLMAAIRFAFDRKREGSQDAGWQKLLNSAHEATAAAQAEATQLRKDNGDLRRELDESRRTLADTSEQLRDALVRNTELERGGKP